MRAWIVTLGIASLGGAAAHFIGAPLPWMLGALFATLLGKAARQTTVVARPLTTLAVLVLGVHIGTTVDRDFVPRLVHVWPSALVLVLVVISGTFATAWLLRRVLKLDRARALCSATPGGVSVMAVIAEDENLGAGVSLAQSVRVVVVVAFVALLAPFLSAPAAHPESFPVAKAPLDLLVLLGCATLGWGLGRLLPLSGGRLIWPLLLAMTAALGGLSHGTFPPLLVAIAQVVFGASLGARWSGTWSEFKQAALAGSLAGFSLLLISAGAAAGVYFLTGGRLSFLTLWLAFSPGGLYEMTLLAGALGADLGLVAAHHLFRLLIIVAMAPGFGRQARAPRAAASPTTETVLPQLPSAAWRTLDQSRAG